MVSVIHFPKVDAKPQPPIFFSNQHHSTGPRAEAPPNCPHLNHLLKVFLHLLREERWDPSITFFKGLGVCNFDGMFNDVTIA